MLVTLWMRIRGLETQSVVYEPPSLSIKQRHHNRSSLISWARERFFFIIKSFPDFGKSRSHFCFKIKRGGGKKNEKTLIAQTFWILRKWLNDIENHSMWWKTLFLRFWLVLIGGCRAELVCHIRTLKSRAKAKFTCKALATLTLWSSCTGWSSSGFGARSISCLKSACCRLEGYDWCGGRSDWWTSDCW